MEKYSLIEKILQIVNLLVLIIIALSPTAFFIFMNELEKKEDNLNLKMEDEIELRQEIKEWRADNYEFGNKTPLERRAEKILKEVLQNMERGSEEHFF